MMWNFGLGPMGVFGGIFMLIFWGAGIVAVVYFIQWLIKSGPNQKNNSALDILKERYAKGEIDKKEFTSKKKDLES